ncbi:MAG: ABC transporter ATP-binding protein [Symbiobacteriaceae bacterium]
MTRLAGESLVKGYVNRRRAVPVLERVSLAVEGGEVLAVLGPSGCGKSTLLRVLAGLEAPDAGRVTLDGAPVRAGQPELALVTQQPHLLPWRTVRGNVEFGGLFTVRDRRELARRTGELLARVGLQEVADWRPAGLSGGMAQRVALARALVRRPRVLLMDEPFSALDVTTRRTLGAEVRRLAREEGVAVVLVTHDVGEALGLADRVVVLSSRPARVVLERTNDDPASLREAILDALGSGRPALAAAPAGGGW